MLILQKVGGVREYSLDMCEALGLSLSTENELVLENVHSTEDVPGTANSYSCK